MYNRIFKADWLLFGKDCTAETAAFLEIALKFFEKAKLPATVKHLKGEFKFKFEDIVNEVFIKDSNNRFSDIKFPDSYTNAPELIKNIKTRFVDENFGVRGKTYAELVEMHSKCMHSNFKSKKKLFDILVEGIAIVLSRPPYNFRCYYRNIESNPYIIIGSWENPEMWGK